MDGHAKKCVERFCELVNKTTQQLYKVSFFFEMVKGKNGLTCDTGPHLRPHARWAHSRKRLELSAGPGAMRRMPSTAHDRSPPSSRTLNAAFQRLWRPLCLMLRQSGQETGCFRQTIDLRPRQQGRGAWPAPFRLPVLGMSVLSAFSPRRVLPGLVAAGSPVTVQCADSVTSIVSWAPPNRDNPSTTTSKRLPSTPGACDKSKSRTITVCRDPCSALSTDACHNNLHLETSPDQST